MAKRKSVSRTPVKKPTAHVSYMREEISNLLPQYYLIRDAVEGEPAIKGMMGGVSAGVVAPGNGGIPVSMTNIMLTRAMRYLPQPNADDLSEQNRERYRAYVTRAVYYGVTGRTLEGMAGQIFLRDPIVAIPTDLDSLINDANGGGLTLNQTAYRLVRHCIAYGRTGILVDYPVQDTPVTKQAVASGEIHPTLTVYNPWDIINWRLEQRGAKRVLTMLVLREIIDEEGDDGFQLSTFEQYRVLRIDTDTGEHVAEIYRGNTSNEAGFQKTSEFFPKDSKGKPLNEIPFHFVGSENNDVSPNRPPLYDLAALNIAHYRNSADYEEACFICGQPTPVLTGLSQDWVENVLKGVVPLGSRASIPLPVGANATLLQARENSMPLEAMKLKEEQMVSIGAKLVQLQRSARSATQQIIETTSESSMLANISQNCTHAMQWALGIAGNFVGDIGRTIKFQLNKDFDLTSMTADDQNAVIKEWQSGAIGFTEMRAAMFKAGIATLSDDDARKAIAKDIADGMIPDPTMQSSLNVPFPKAASDAGGPQPGARRRISAPTQ